VFIDASYKPLRRHGSNLAVLCAWHITNAGRCLLVYLLRLSETRGAERSLVTVLDVTTDVSCSVRRHQLRPGFCDLVSAAWLLWPGPSGLVPAAWLLWPDDLVG
jgi:hypothetical protein